MGVYSTPKTVPWTPSSRPAYASAPGLAMAGDYENKVLLTQSPTAKRPSSPARPNVPNFSRPSIAKRIPENPCAELLPKNNLEQPDPIAASCRPQRATNIRRWDGNTRTQSSWDGLRRDEELWLPEGDCLVHFYSKGHSRRGPSLRVPFESLKQAQCGPLFQIYLAQLIPVSDAVSPAGSDFSKGGGTNSSITSFTGAKFELFIPCPEDIPKEERFLYHLTTRNFFAWMLHKPLVGNHLGKSMVDLLDRMMLFRKEEVDNVQDFTAYLEQSGYLDFGNCPDYALAMLSFAEHFELRDLWIDAFVHCVGMNENLGLSPEFEAISRVTKALVTRAYLEMDLHLGRVSRSLSNFLDDDLSSSHLGLSEGARIHLDRFRSFLHSYYVNKFGYWPPPDGLPFSKSLYRSMYDEFSKLYSYLADTENTDIIQKAASGGICVLQNVDAFDGRHKYDPLPYQLPLLPEHEVVEKRTQPQKSRRSLRLSSWDTKRERKLSVGTALAAATNSKDATVTSCSLVQEYAHFERDLSLTQEEKVSVSDARKVRWLLIYGVVQMLISVTRAPPEVRDTEGSTYPLCCLTAGTPPWAFSSKSSLASPIESPITPSPASELSAESEQADCHRESIVSIHPDCETDNFFSNIPFNRRADTDASCIPQPLRPLNSRTVTSASVPVMRTSSIRRNLHLPKRFSQRRTGSIKAPIPVRPSQFCEILVHGYGNGLNEARVDEVDETNADVDAPVLSASCSLDGCLSSSTRALEDASARSEGTKPTFLEQARGARTPTLNPVQLDAIHAPLPSLPVVSSPLFWAKEAESLSSSALSNSSQLSISIYDIAAATAAGCMPPSPPSSASSNYSRDSLHDDGASSGCWSTTSLSEVGLSPGSGASASIEYSLSSSPASVIGAIESRESAFPERVDLVDVAKANGGGDANTLSLSGFAKMLAPEEASDCGGGNGMQHDEAGKVVKAVDSLESLRAKYMDIDILSSLMPELEGDIGLGNAS